MALTQKWGNGHRQETQAYGKDIVLPEMAHFLSA